ncbi:MAG: hypothetical protein ABIU96_01175 [Rhodanobacter sp.]
MAATLKQAAVDAIKSDFHFKHTGGGVKIVESGADTKNSSLIIKPGHGGVAVLSFDKPRTKGGGDPVFPYFIEGVPGLCRKCDAIAIFQHEDISWVIAIELKSRNFGSAAEQLNAGTIFSRFLAHRLSSLVNAKLDIMVGAVLFAISPIVQKRAKQNVLNVRDIEGVKAAVVYDKLEIHMPELLKFVIDNKLARTL